MIEDIVNLPKMSIRIVDIGAAFFGQAQPYQKLLDRGLATLLAFEPDEEEREKLQRHLGSQAKVLPYAVGDGRPHTMHICPAGLGMNSLLEPDPINLNFFNNFGAWGAVERKVEIETIRLDDCSDVDEIDYLKMDVQGSELMILKNGETKLSSCSMMQIEVSFITLYKHQPAFGDIDCYVRQRGFIPHCFSELKKWSIAPTRLADDTRMPFNQLLEADIVYMRDFLHGEIDDLALKKLAVVAHYCYASPDLAARCIIELHTRGLVPADAQRHYYESLLVSA